MIRQHEIVNSGSPAGLLHMLIHKAIRESGESAPSLGMIGRLAAATAISHVHGLSNRTCSRA
ncbi:hypothetical protein [Streptomyces sp. NPDC091040]|uniref:hypothetical protein n=1 Tax=Streptomyces sp. NPDC091040 TaxID=3365972 RepID=UPI00381D7489